MKKFRGAEGHKPKETLAFARAYAERGWPVFPLTPKKKTPATRHGFHDSSTDDSKIKSWFGGQTKYGIGIPTGAVSGLVVVDIDPRNGGWETYQRLCAEGKMLPKGALSVRTSGDPVAGQHWYFKIPAGVEALPSCPDFLPGIDVKADGGYVCAPPSVHPSGVVYTHLLNAQELEPLPDWILQKMKARRRESGKRALKEVEDGKTTVAVVEGQRNTHLTSLGGRLRRDGYNVDTMLSVLLTANEQVCDPPLPEEEVRAIVYSLKRYDPDPSAPVRAVESEEPIAPTIVGFGELAGEGLKPPDWVIPNRLCQGDVALLAGAPACGKSWLSLEIAVAGALGRPIMNLASTVFGRMRTLIIDEENTKDEMQARLHKLLAAHGKGPECYGLLNDQVKLVLQQGISFGNPKVMDWALATIREFQPHTIILDSATALAGIDNDNDAMKVRRFFTEKLYPLRQVCNSTILLLHHTSKQVYQDEEERIERAGLPRGSIDWMAAVDSAMLIIHPENSPHSYLHQIKQRRGSSPPPLRFLVADIEGVANGVRPIAQERQAAGNGRTPEALNKSGVVRKAILQIMLEQPDMVRWPRTSFTDHVHLYAANIERGLEITRHDIKNALASLERRDVIRKTPEEIILVGDRGLIETLYETL